MPVDSQRGALAEGDRAVHVVVHDEQRRLDLVEPEERRVLDVAHRHLPETAAEPALRALVLELPAHAALEPDAAAGARHVGDRRARTARPKGWCRFVPESYRRAGRSGSGRPTLPAVLHNEGGKPVGSRVATVDIRRFAVN
jgi:hypothetical protein